MFIEEKNTLNLLQVRTQAPVLLQEEETDLDQEKNSSNTTRENNFHHRLLKEGTTVEEDDFYSFNVWLFVIQIINIYTGEYIEKNKRFSLDPLILEKV